MISSTISTLKWLWDPRTDEQKRRKPNPLRRYTQTFYIYIKGIDTPFERVLELEDRDFGEFKNRVDLEDSVHAWLSYRGKTGIIIDKVWYAPDQIVRIEIGEYTVEEI